MINDTSTRFGDKREPSVTSLAARQTLHPMSHYTHSNHNQRVTLDCLFAKCFYSWITESRGCMLIRRSLIINFSLIIINYWKNRKTIENFSIQFNLLYFTYEKWHGNYQTFCIQFRNYRYVNFVYIYTKFRNKIM